MSFIATTVTNALRLLFPPSPEIWSIVGLSLSITLTALFLGLCLGIPLGTLLSLKLLPGKNQTTGLVFLSMGFPPLLIGLAVSLLFWPQGGPFGFLGLLYTPAALVITHTLIVLPIMIGFTMTGIRQINPELMLQFRALGASPPQLLGLVLWEIRYTLLGAMLISWGRLLTEVGATLMTGGNLSASTQPIATALTTENSQGNLEISIALGIILLLSFIILGFLLAYILKRRNTHEYSH